MTQKIIFLDIDGVLNRSLPPEDINKYKSDEDEAPRSLLLMECIENLNWIIRETQSQVVLSTDWRQWCTIPDLQQQFEEAGFCGKIIGKTPIIDGVERGYEIMGWLHSYGEAVQSFVILDDRSDMGPYSEQLIQTEWDIGLTRALGELAIEKLGREKHR